MTKTKIKTGGQQHWLQWCCKQQKPVVVYLQSGLQWNQFVSCYCMAQIHVHIVCIDLGKMCSGCIVWTSSVAAQSSDNLCTRRYSCIIVYRILHRHILLYKLCTHPIRRVSGEMNRIISRHR